MPPEVEEKAPEKASFESGLVSNENLQETLDNNAALITKGRSFMDKGEAAFTNEEIAAKEDAAVGARETLIARMQRENARSEAEANHVRDQHLTHKQNAMDAAILEAKERKKATYIARAEFYAAFSKTGPTNALRAMQEYGGLVQSIPNVNREFLNVLSPSFGVIRDSIANGRGAFMRTITFAGARRNSAQKASEKADERYQESIQKIPRLAAQWDRFLDEYRMKNYKVRSRNYDRLFKSYYMLSRGKDLTTAGLGSNFSRPNQQGFAEANRNNAKNIVEYMGKYNNPQGIVNAIEANPFGNITSEIIARKGLGQDSSNTMEGMMKRHTMVTMEAFGVDSNGRQVTKLSEEQAGVQPVQRVRIKIDNQFRGYKAKNQLNAEGTLAVDDNFAGKGDDARRDMSALNLVVDEKGANGAYIYSQRSAKLYSGKNRRTGNTTTGFLMNGEFISSDKNTIQSPTEAKSDYKDELKQERLRAAIRRSDFFGHINKGSIQYYMNYDDVTGNVSQQDIEEKLLSKRAGLFSWTKFKQNLYDGTFFNTIGGFIGAYEGDQKNIPFVPDDAIEKIYGKYASTTGSIMNLDKSFYLGYAGMAVTAITPVAAIMGQGAAGARLSVLLGNIVAMLQNIATFVDLGKKWKKCKPGDQKWPLVMDFIDNALGLFSNIGALIDNIAGKLWSDQIKGILSIIKNAFAILRDTITLIGSGVEKYRITKSDNALKTAMEAFKNPGNEEGEMANPDDIAKGEALSNNAQSKMFLALARKRASRDQFKAGFDMVSKGLDTAGTVMGLGEKSAWFNPISLPFKLAGKVVAFLGMGVNKFLGKLQRESNIGVMLGDEKLDKVSGFDTILKEETGINNRHYISDLMRVFMSIDTHCLLNKSVANQDHAGFRLAKDVIKPYYQQKDNEDNAEFVRRVSFNRLLKAAGAPSDWRSVLLASIS